MQTPTNITLISYSLVLHTVFLIDSITNIKIKAEVNKVNKVNKVLIPLEFAL